MLFHTVPCLRILKPICFCLELQLQFPAFAPDARIHIDQEPEDRAPKGDGPKGQRVEEQVHPPAPFPSSSERAYQEHERQIQNQQEGSRDDACEKEGLE